MDDSKERPRAGDPPRLDEPIEILRELLAVERARLTVALRIEEERKIVFPETTVIIKDIERLMMEVEARESGSKSARMPGEIAPDHSAAKKRSRKRFLV